MHVGGYILFYTQEVHVFIDSLCPDVREILSFPRLGFVLVYTASRLASFSTIKFLSSKLPAVPKLILAVSDKSCDNHLIDLGREYAEATGAGFISTSDPEWSGTVQHSLLSGTL